MKLYLKILTLFCLILSGEICWAQEEPFSVYLTWQRNPESTMSIQWISSIDDVTDVIEFQGEGEEQWHEVQGYHREMPCQLPFFIHFVELKELQASSGYRFRLKGCASDYKFRTLPNDLSQPIRFIVGGDMYNGSLELMEQTNRAAAATEPSFVVIGGDIAYSATSNSFRCEDGKKWLDWLKAWKNTMVTPQGYLIPILPAIGNHEVRGGSNCTPNEAEFFYALFPLPGPKGYNVLDFCDYMTIVFLDSGHTNPIAGEQTDWLKETLMHRCRYPHKFAVYHIPAYPSYRNYHAPASRYIRKYWVPLFEQYGVHAAFENNDHAYKRTHPILRSRVQSKGVLYIGDGAWSVENVRKPKTPKQAWYIAKSSPSLYFLLVTIDGTRRRYQAITPNGCMIDDISQ